MISLLIGSLPVEGPAILAQLGIPFILLVDPVDEPATSYPGAVRVVSAPFKRDPLSVLHIPLQEDITDIFSFTELGSLPAALLAEVLGLATVSTATVLKVRNKFLMRRALTGKVNQPKFGLVDATDPETLPFPVIVKPVDGSASRGVMFIDSLLSYREHISPGEKYIWEQYIDGPEFSVEAVSWNGHHQILGITEKITTGPPTFVESAHLVPARLSSQDQSNIVDAVTQCLDILDIHVGASHTEVKYQASQAYIIETHTRPGGDRIPLLTKLVSGYDQFELAVHAIRGMKMPTPTDKAYPYAGIRYFKWPKGLVSTIAGLEGCSTLPGFVALELKVAPGTKMPEWQHSLDRPGFVIIGGDTPEDLEKGFLAVEAQIYITYDTQH